MCDGHAHLVTCAWCTYPCPLQALVSKRSNAECFPVLLFQAPDMQVASLDKGKKTLYDTIASLLLQVITSDTQTHAGTALGRPLAATVTMTMTRSHSDWQLHRARASRAAYAHQRSGIHMPWGTTRKATGWNEVRSKVYGIANVQMRRTTAVVQLLPRQQTAH